jgi:hypothetical protein
MANVNIQLGYKDNAWFTANATLVLLAGQVVYLQQTGQYKIGNGVTQLSALAFLGSSVIATETQLVTATVVNKTGVDLLASNYQAVKVSTAQGQRLAVDFAQANNDNNSADTIGLVRENISNNQEGDVVILGQIVEVNTTGSLQGETWTDGDVLYLSPTTAGRITNVKPTGLTGHIVVIGYIEYAHAIHGKIYTKIMNGWELEELHNVADISYTTPIDADSLLIKDSTASLWKRLTWANLKSFFVSKTATETITGTKTFSNSTFNLDIDGTGKTLTFSSWAAPYSTYGWGISSNVNKLKLPSTIYIGDSSYVIDRFDSTGDPVGSLYGGAFNTFKDFKARSIFSNKTFVYGVDSTGYVGIGTTTPSVELEVNGKIKTSQPSANGAGAWKLGKKVTATVTIKTTEYIEVDIDGVIYKLALVN